jgi:hypothetical protein
LAFFARRRPRKGMRLRLSAGKGAKTAQASGRNYSQIAAELKGATPPAKPDDPQNSDFNEVTHIRAEVARPLNVHFNYNGHSWDAYEVLGLPAGSSLEKVEAAYEESVARVDVGSRPFMDAAYKAITGRTKILKASS